MRLLPLVLLFVFLAFRLDYASAQMQKLRQAIPVTPYPLTGPVPPAPTTGFSCSTRNPVREFLGSQAVLMDNVMKRGYKHDEYSGREAKCQLYDVAELMRASCEALNPKKPESASCTTCREIFGPAVALTLQSQCRTAAATIKAKYIKDFKIEEFCSASADCARVLDVSRSLKLKQSGKNPGDTEFGCPEPMMPDFASDFAYSFEYYSPHCAFPASQRRGAEAEIDSAEEPSSPKIEAEQLINVQVEVIA